MAQNADQAGSAAPSGEEANPASSLDDIVVTAQRRAQRLQDVPIAVTALGGEQLKSAGITSSHDLAQAVTGMVMTESVGFVQPFIRGIGTTATNLGEQGTAAIYVDGVYMPTLNGQFYELANLQSIEVLRGPQGTLFGRNANSGAILITTRPPSLERSEGSLSVGYGNYNAITANGYVSVPLSERAAFSIAGTYENHESWYTRRGLDVFANTRRWTLRGTALFEATDNLTITLSGDYSDMTDPGLIISQPVGGYQGLVAGGLVPTGPYDFIGNVTNPDILAFARGVSARVRWDLGPVALTSITAYRGFYNESRQYDSDTTPTPIVQIDQLEEGDSFTQELQLNSDHSGPLNWVVGGFFMQQNALYNPQNVLIGATLQSTLVQQTTNAFAGFSDATLDLGVFEITGGLRYSYEEKKISGQRGGAPVITNVKAHWSSVTPRAVLTYHPNRDFMAYASFTQGFKSGTFNASNLSPVPIDPETVDAYEIGFKWTPMQHTSLNVSAFHYDIKDLQVQALNPATNLVGLANAGKMRAQGVDIEFATRPADALNLRLGLSYLNTKFTSFTNAQIFTKVPNSDGRNQSIIADVTGNENVRSPGWTFNGAIDYRFDFSNGAALVPAVNLYYSSKFFWDVGNRLVEPEHVVINANLTYNFPGDRFSMTVWGRNLTNELRARSYLPTTQADRRIADEPRVFGIRAGYKF